MTPAEELLAEMRTRGVQLEAHGDGVRIVDGELDDRDIERLRANKAELARLLRPAPPPGPARAPSRVRITGAPPPEPEPPPAPAGEWIEPDPVRSERARNHPRDGGGRFLPSEARQAAGRRVEAEQLLARLQDAGVVLRAQGDRVVRIDGPDLSSETRDQVRRVKAELLPLLSQIGRLDRFWYGAEDVA